MINYYTLYYKLNNEHYTSIYSTDCEKELFEEIKKHKKMLEDLMVATPIKTVTGNCLIEYLKLLEKLYN